MKKAYKKLSLNISLFSISLFGTKIINFLLVPLYTNCLSTAEYGTADMLSTVVQLLVPIFTLDIADAVIRFALEENDKKENVFLFALRVNLLGSALLFAIMFLLYTLKLINVSERYMVFIFVSYFFTSIYNTITNYFRGRDKIIDIVISGILSTLCNGLSNIIFLLYLDMGIKGYLYANLLSISIPTFFLLIRSWQYGFFSIKNVKIDKKLQKEMLKYCTPLIINGLSWWINNSIDRFFVNAICGINANGLLAVAYKIPSILAMFQTIFNQAWTMSAIQEFDPEDKSGFLTKTYTYYGGAMIFASAFILLANIPIAKLLYAKDFFEAWRYTGFYVLASLISAMSICISGVFNAVKDSKILGISTLLGAIINILCNVVFINLWGVLGAAVATLLSNIVIWIYRMAKVKKYVYLKINIKRDICAYTILGIMCGASLTENHLYIVQISCIFILCYLYIKELIKIIECFKRKIMFRI